MLWLRVGSRRDRCNVPLLLGPVHRLDYTLELEATGFVVCFGLCSQGDLIAFFINSSS